MNESKLSPEDERLINDMNDPALAEAFNVMRALDAWRRTRRLSEVQVATEMGTKQSAVSEMGRCDPVPSLVVAIRYARAVGVDVGVVVPDEDAYVSREFQYPWPSRMVITKRSTGQE